MIMEQKNQKKKSCLIEHQELYKLYGTEEEFPLIHALIKNTPDGILKKAAKKKMLEDDPYIAWAVYKPASKVIKGKVIISLTQIAQWIDTRWRIISTSGEFIGSGYQTLYEKQYATYDILIENVDLSHFASKELIVTLTTIWQGNKEQFLKSGKTEDIIYLEADTVVSDITVNDPAKQPLGPNIPEILVYYGRSPGSREYVDYDYSAEYNGQEVFLKMATSGSAKVSKTVENVDKSKTVLKIDWGIGSRKYSNTKIAYSWNKNSFEWHFDPDWLVTLSKEFFYAINKCDYDLYIEFSCQGLSEPQHIHVSSTFDEEKLEPNCKKIPKLDLRLGCIAKGCRVLMADGSKKPVELIRIGDQVMSPHGVTCVINTFQGPENTLVCIRTIHGKEIHLTESHAVFTDQGLFMAKDINAGMRVLTSDNVYEEIYFLYNIPNDDMVYNLEITKTENQPCIICEDIVIGDVNTVTQKMNPVIDKIAPALKAELDKLHNYLKENK
ncbi:hypothetical protein GCM10007084_12080 [Parabacteroides faecis]|nr:hypothetical protein GCM10007084_12080 [Parabacteroides faecis]